ncbi:MAG: hypothetical protein ACHP7N_02435 [Caulobacterales bacterium]
MQRLLSASALIATLAFAGAASAAGSSATVGPMNVTGNVPALCSGGTVTNNDTVFALGTLIDTATGLMLPNLSAPPKTVTGSFCNTKSSISVVATPLLAQSFTGTPPADFTKALDYTATASGWTTTAASFTTDAASNPAATQTRDTAFTGTITVAVSAFAPVGGPSLRLVADPNYQGTVTITLAVVS